MHIYILYLFIHLSIEYKYIYFYIFKYIFRYIHINVKRYLSIKIEKTGHVQGSDAFPTGYFLQGE